MDRVEFLLIQILKRMHLQPILKPLALKEVPKVIQAMRQTQSRKVLVKLLTRIKVRLFFVGFLWILFD